MTPAELYRAAFGEEPAHIGEAAASGQGGVVNAWPASWRIWTDAGIEVRAPTPAQALRAWRALHGQDDPVLAVMEAGGLDESGRKVIEWRTSAGLLRVTLEVEGPEAVEPTAEDAEWARRELRCDDGKGSTYYLMHYVPDPRTEEQWLLGAVVETPDGRVAVTTDREPCRQCLGAQDAAAFRMCRERMRQGEVRNLSPYVVQGKARQIPASFGDPVASVRSLLERLR